MKPRRQHQNAGESAWYLGPYFIMCCVMLAAVLIYPLVQSFAGVILLRVLLTAILLSTLYTTTHSPLLFRVVLVLMIPAVLTNWVTNPIDQPGLFALASSATLIAMLIAVAAILLHIITAKDISQDIIFGSVAVYLLAGVMWAVGFQFVNDLQPGTVFDSMGSVLTAESRAALFSEFTYFSFVTLTSVGYGDLTPSGAPARALALVEGIFGQLYTAILIGKLVGMRVAQE